MTPSKNPQHEQARQQLEQQIREYQAKGGSIKQLKTGASAIDHRSVGDYAINVGRRDYTTK